jgi:hypothetical protein
MAKKKVVNQIGGLVLLKGKHAAPGLDGEVTEVGLSFSPQDEQGVTMEVAVSPEVADTLQVDKSYNVTIEKGKKGDRAFNISHLNTVRTGNYEEKLTVKGDIQGHIHLNIKPEQEEFFFEGDDCSISLTEFVEEEA